MSTAKIALLFFFVFKSSSTKPLMELNFPWTFLANKTDYAVSSHRSHYHYLAKGGNLKDTSDNFFKKNKKNFDVIFIDGLHHYEQCRKDIINSLKVLNKNGFIFLHDMIPRSWLEENVPRLSGLWSGDVWKVALELIKTKGIDFFVIKADRGVGVIKKREQDVIYHDDYNNIKNLKFKDFLNLNNQINYIEAEQALKLISPL